MTLLFNYVLAAASSNFYMTDSITVMRHCAHLLCKINIWESSHGYDIKDLINSLMVLQQKSL